MNGFLFYLKGPYIIQLFIVQGMSSTVGQPFKGSSKTLMLKKSSTKTGQFDAIYGVELQKGSRGKNPFNFLTIKSRV